MVKAVLVTYKANRMVGRQEKVELCVGAKLNQFSNEVFKRPNINKLRGVVC